MSNRWLAGALPAVMVHVSIGSVYSFSTLTKPLMAELEAPESTIKWAFSVAIFFLGLSAAGFGKFVQDFGPRVSARIAGCCFGCGLILAGFATLSGSVLLLFLSYGVLGGVGLGTGYITPVKTLIQWFYDRKGMATGLAVMGFGFGSVIAGPVYAGLIDAFSEHGPGGEVVAYHVAPAFFIMGAVYGALMILASFVIKVPPATWGQTVGEDGKAVVRQRQYQTGRALRTWQFYALWVMLFVNISCGIGLIYTASPMMQHEVGVNAETAALLAVSGVAVFNGLGRFGWASLSDKLGRPATFTGFYLLQILAFGALGFLLAAGHVPQGLFLCLIYLIATCYGGGFATIPAYLSDLFGNANVSAIHGWVLTAWSMAGIVGPTILVAAKGADDNYPKAMFVYVGMLAVAGVVSLALLAALRRTRGGPDPLRRVAGEEADAVRTPTGAQ
ncbi:MAG: OFA family MFS transporter [Bifidobacteriaceae bacterium]|jgi:OFA family oxalate/formate antiporter-like MFS transporter|nr:OFA family MFS transporter [Bifidobacteriaceae bacterium]